jgi:hypothetical protein
MLLLSVVATTETLVSGNKFLYACVKEVYCLSAKPCFDILHQIFITVEAL